jgi:exodeoxyribonuclease VII small subunit
MPTAKTSSETPKNSIETVNYEKAVSELEKLIADMESGKLSLEETLSSYKRGSELIKHCQSLLEQVEQQIKISEDN